MSDTTPNPCFKVMAPATTMHVPSEVCMLAPSAKQSDASPSAQAVHAVHARPSAPKCPFGHAVHATSAVALHFE